MKSFTAKGLARALIRAQQADHLSKREIDSFVSMMHEVAMGMSLDLEEGRGDPLGAQDFDLFDSIHDAFETEAMKKQCPEEGCRRDHDDEDLIGWRCRGTGFVTGAVPPNKGHCHQTQCVRCNPTVVRCNNCGDIPGPGKPRDYIGQVCGRDLTTGAEPLTICNGSYMGFGSGLDEQVDAMGRITGYTFDHFMDDLKRVVQNATKGK